jgi:hypothetical protein
MLGDYAQRYVVVRMVGLLYWCYAIALVGRSAAYIRWNLAPSGGLPTIGRAKAIVPCDRLLGGLHARSCESPHAPRLHPRRP